MDMLEIKALGSLEGLKILSTVKIVEMLVATASALVKEKCSKFTFPTDVMISMTLLNL